jgi:hypothetical protein
VINRGNATAHTGENRAVGNASSNTATNSQGASGGGPAVNFAAAENKSNGSASITTGAADALGNQATSTDLDVLNRGVASAITGGNRAVGNASGNTADNLQTARGGRVATNSATALNSSDGTATITTGNAVALGNDASSEGGGTVINRGFARAVTGVNSATGNASSSSSFGTQFAAAGIAANTAQADNASTGTARVVTGSAQATGNRSATTITQDDEGDDDLVNDITQDVLVINRGSAVAVTGDNRAVGNSSFNDAELTQRAFGFRVGANSGNVSSHSDGVASISTGSATATGNESNTDVVQSAAINPGSSPLALVDQAIVIRNVGDASAISGRNAGTGNGSVNIGVNRQLAGAVAAVHSNSGSSANDSDGTVDIDTGDAWALGNHSETSGSQSEETTAAA